MLQFSAPWALAAALAAVWLLWRARRPLARRTITVANLLLWRSVRPRPVDATRTDRPRPPWLVWLQAAVLLSAAVAASGPARLDAGADAAIVIDTSASMGAREATGARLELARAAVRQWLASRPNRDRVLILAAAGKVSELGTFRADDRTIDAALTNLVADGSTFAAAEGVNAARSRTGGPIAVFSDLAAPANAGAELVDWHRVGSPLDNVGIVALRADDPARALVEVRNFGARPRVVVLSLLDGSREFWRQTLSLEPRQTRAFLPPANIGSASISARLQFGDGAGDALAGDDVRTAALTAPTVTRVRLVSAGNRFLEAALRALPTVELTLSALTSGPPPDDGVVVVCDGCPEIPRAPALWIPPTAAPQRADAPLVVVRVDHPVMLGVDTSDARIAPANPALSMPGSLATADGATAFAADDTPAGRRVVLNADLAQSSLPLSAAFPVFVANAINWISGRHADLVERSTLETAVESDLRDAPAPTLDLSPRTTPGIPRGLGTVLALLTLALLVWEWFMRRRDAWLRLSAAAAIAVAISGGRVPGCTSQRVVAIAIDGSGSVATVQRDALARAGAEAARMRDQDRVSVLAFGAAAQQVRGEQSARQLDTITLPAPSASSNIAAGILAAGRALPREGDRRILLMTDGQATTGDAASAADAAGVPIDVVPLDDQMTPQIRRLEAPLESRRGAAVPLRATIAGPPGARLSIDLSRDGAVIATRAVLINSSGTATIAWTDTPAHAGLTFYRASLMDPRLGVLVSESGAGVTVGGRGRVLVISDRPGAFSTRVRSAPVDIDDRPVTLVPETRAGLAAYAAIVLDAVAPHRLTTRQQDAISDAIALDGTGLLFLGDRDSLDASEHAASRIATSLPIDFTTLPRPPASSMALALLVDTSGSMAATSAGVTKISAARDAVARALSVVPATDAVTVIGFSATPTAILGPSDARTPASVAERFKSLTPSGGTALAPAITRAVAWLNGVANPVKRILLVSDGRTSPSDAEAARAAIRGSSIEVSVVSIGDDADAAWLTSFARATGGQALFPESLAELPRTVARAAARGASDRQIDEPVRIRAGAHPLAPETPVRLNGYVAGELRSGATAAWKSETDDPVLAAWPYGLGRVATLASDLHGPWGAPLAQWRDDAAFWRRCLLWLTRAGDIDGVDVALDSSTLGPVMTVDMIAGVDATAAPQVTVTLVAPSGATTTSQLHTLSAGRSAGLVTLPEVGDYRASIDITDPLTGWSTRLLRGWFWSGDLEAQARGINLSVLQDIARRSGGALLAPGPTAAVGAGVFDLPRRRATYDLFTALLLLAALLLFADYRRALRPEAHS